MATGIALVGSGIFVKDEHLPAVQATQLLSLKAIYSRSLKSAKAVSEHLSDIDLYSEDSEGKTYDDLLKREDIKGVIIALPILVQLEYIKKALAAGKHVLAEKPIAKDVATAQELMAWTSDPANTSASYSVAENFRYMDSFLYASSALKDLGRILTFRSRVSLFVTPGGKYFETPWRKVPEYQGGFLLDGGVHFIAGTRLLLQGGGEVVSKLSAFTAQLQRHLPPVDTLHATLQTTSGVSGTLSISFGTTDSGSEYVVAAEKGTVTVTRSKVEVTRDGNTETKECPEEGSGVKQEVKAWAEGLAAGKPNKRQSPMEALEDLKILEAALRSGEKGGAPVDI
ncbi:NAD(P)-binding protein [Didymella exigua CBS 183.55]|uniref:NAD(P)-binding protein n=1 Tax=Didymella exigua CBS 183.55 TaxID=1150837 RepID=A0A6A5S4A2_9PLEO|nr:NAD(P)-binding protein [Didymella exigua CBS 183.55]KAF1933306.1 NAD(P)-binding protein [Didymella exigua CBS 183.55]